MAYRKKSTGTAKPRRSRNSKTPIVSSFKKTARGAYRGSIKGTKGETTLVVFSPDDESSLWEVQEGISCTNRRCRVAVMGKPAKEATAFLYSKDGRNFAVRVPRFNLIGATTGKKGSWLAFEKKGTKRRRG